MSSTYSQVDYVAGTAAARMALGSLLRRARTVANGGEARTLRWLHIGDSRATIPGGQGAAQEHFIGLMLAQRFGNIPEVLVGATLWKVDETKQAGFCKGGFQNNMVAGAMPVSKLPRGFYTNKVGNWHGQLCTLIPSNYAFAPAGARNISYYRGGNDTLVDILGAPKSFTEDVSTTLHDEVEWRARTNDGTPNYFTTEVGTGITTTLDLTTASGAVRTETVGPFTWATNRALEIQMVCPTAATKQSEVYGVRFRNPNRTDGVSVIMGGTGGQTYAEELADRPSVAAVLQAFEIDVVYFQFSANDAFAGVGKTPAQFKADAAALLAVYSAALPNAVLIVETGTFYSNPDDVNYATKIAALNEYAGALEELTATVPNLLVFNTRRITEELGWTAFNEGYSRSTFNAFNAGSTYAVDALVTSNSLKYKCIVATSAGESPTTHPWKWIQCQQYLIDDVHYTDAGAAMYAKAIGTCLSLLEPAAQRAADVAETQAAKWAGEAHLGVNQTAGVVVKLVELP
jgi:lysophospholipase L1-like esterase